MAEERKYFVPNKVIAQGVYNEEFDKIRRFANGIGWDNLPAVNEDARKFSQGLLEMGINEGDITANHNISFDDFDALFRGLHDQVKANTRAGEKTLVIIDVASHGT